MLLYTILPRYKHCIRSCLASPVSRLSYRVSQHSFRSHSTVFISIINISIFNWRKQLHIAFAMHFVLPFGKLQSFTGCFVRRLMPRIRRVILCRNSLRIHRFCECAFTENETQLLFYDGNCFASLEIKSWKKK